MKLVSGITGIDYALLRQWKLQPWWKDFENEIRATQNIEMDNKLTKIVDKSLDAVMDRLENGDFFYDQKTGKVKRKPISMRDAVSASKELLTKRELIRDGITEKKETSQVSVTEQLKTLAQEFAKWANKPNKSEAIDIEFKEVTNDAIYEERVVQESDSSRTTGIHEGKEQEVLFKESRGLGEDSSN